MTISPSVSQGTLNRLNNLTGGWYDRLTEAPEYLVALTEQAFDDAFSPVDPSVSPEEAQKQAEAILRTRQYHEDMERREREEKDFYRNLERSRPVMGADVTSQTIQAKGRYLAERLMEIAVNGMSLNVALSFCQKMLAQDLGLDTDPVSFPRKRIENMGRDISTIPTMKLLCEHFGLDKEMTEAVLSKELGRMYRPEGEAEKPRKDAPLARHPVQRVPYTPRETQFPSDPFARNKTERQRYEGKPRPALDSNMALEMANILRNSIPED